jgi:sugar phosphate isomerase/epimerase
MEVGIGASSDVAATVERCRQLGVKRVFISCASLPGYAEHGYPDAAALRAFKGRLEEQGIALPSATYWFAKWPPRPGWRTGATNPDILLSRDRRCIDAMLRMIEILGEAGITSVLHYVDLGKPEEPAEVEVCWEGLREIYRELIHAAERAGVGIGNHSLHRLLPDGLRERAVAEGVRLQDYGSYQAEGWGGPFLVGTWEELRRLVSAVPSPSNGVTLCTGMDIPGGDVPALVAEFAGKIHFCQLRDHSDRWPAGCEVPLGEGRVDFPRIVAALRAAGYDGILHPEHLGKPRSEDEDLLAKALAYVRGLLGPSSSW